MNSLLMVKKYVYDLHEITLPQLADILRTNWENAPELRQRVLCDTVKWGNGIPEADRLAQDLFEFMGSQIIGVPTASGGVFRMGADSVDMAALGPMDLVDDGGSNIKTQGFDVVEFEGVHPSLIRRARRYASNGWIGKDDPRQASAEWGEQMLTAFADWAVKFVDAFAQSPLPPQADR